MALRTGDPIEKLPGVGAATAKKFHHLGLRTLSDLLRHYPLRYEEHADEGDIASLPVDAVGSTRGTVEASRVVGGGRQGHFGKKARFECVLSDGRNTLLCTFFNAGYLSRQIRPGMRLRVQGKTKAFRGTLQMVSPKFEVLTDAEQGGTADANAVLEPEGSGQAGDAGVGCFHPVYPTTEGLPSDRIAKAVAAALEATAGRVPDPVPPSLLEHHAMPPLGVALRRIHRPTNADDAASARRRIAYNELLLLQLGIALKRSYVDHRLTAPALRFSPAVHDHILQRFPFELTGAQARVVAEIAADVQRTRPMNRLLQGDVGAGKTLVAVYAMLLAVASGKQAALMAPTELLAEQHLASIRGLFPPDAGVRVELVTGSQKAGLAAVEDGSADIVVGTHALITGGVRFHDLAVAVVDEQHRFGVRQRAVLKTEAGTDGDPGAPAAAPHTLVMTATPIPRTLSLTLFGDLDVSVLDELPPGRTAVTNRVVGPEKEDDVYTYVEDRLAASDGPDAERVYVVCPAVEEGEPLPNGEVLRNVTDHAEDLRARGWGRFGVEVVHGRLKPDERDAAMARFKTGQSRVLVATTVIEVGVDVPEATVMVIEHADRFGLAQLHQLRGRIGRGRTAARPLCVFITHGRSQQSRQRMQAIGSTNDGFKVAELDLEIRGMGDFFGTRQSGAVGMRLARIPEDLDLLKLARRDAAAMITADPLLEREEHAALRRVMVRQHGEALGLIDVG